MTITTRDYQQRVINDARILLRDLKPSGRKPRIVLRVPCGGGKTRIAAFMAHSAMQNPERRVAFLAHRDFLIQQASQTFEEHGIPHGYLQAGKHLNPYLRCHVGMIGSMRSRQSKIKPPDICFIDECHHSPANTYKAIFDAWPETTFIGLTATSSDRTDGKGLDQIFDGMVHGPHEHELIAAGHLSDYVWYSPSKPDLSKIHTRAGEYVTRELDEEMTKSVIVADIVDSYRKYADGTVAVYFATSVDTSRRYVERFNAAGIPAAHLDANSPPAERLRAIREWARGNVKVISNVGLFGEGFDAAAISGMDITIETVGLCRPTKSFPLLVQMAMRAMRRKPHAGIILDHAGCYDEHQWLPDDIVNWSLSGSARRDASDTWECDGCGARVQKQHRSCPHCGFVRQVSAAAPARRTIEHVDGDMIMVDRERRSREAAREARKSGDTAEMAHLIALAVTQGESDPRAWAAQVVAERTAAAYRR